MASPELSILKKQTESPEKKLEMLNQEVDINLEMISDIPVFTIETNDSKAILKIAQHYGQKAVFRIINANFVPIALEFGTDKGRVEEHDFRRVADGSGYDVWGVEEKAAEMGLNKSDVFCGTPYDFFIKDEDGYSSRGLGIPEDRSAILVFDGTKLQEIPETDGFAFLNPDEKRSALLGIIKFRESFVDFEKKLKTLESEDEKIALIETEVFQNLNNKEDLSNAPHIAINIIELLHQQSLKNSKTPYAESAERIKKLKSISDRLDYEIRMIEIVDNMEGQVKMTREAFVTSNTRKMDMMRTWPDFVIETTNSYLREMALDEKYKKELLRIIEEAKRCKDEFDL